MRRPAGRALLVTGVLAVCVFQGWPQSSASGLALVAAAGEAPAAPAAEAGFVTKVVGAAVQGAVAACVAAFLSAFTEPIVNRLLVDRCTVGQAIAAVKVQDCLKFFLTTFPTNMLKFPIFEVINMILSYTSMSGSIRGVVNGWLFCTIMLPVTNYRFRKSMNLKIEASLLYQAYPPTVLRDIFYGWARGACGASITKIVQPSGSLGNSFVFGLTVLVACVVSSPFNEYRGYWLQAPEKKLPFGQFFKPERYVRSTGVGATIMGVSLMVGRILVPFAEMLFEYLKTNKTASIILAAAIIIPFLMKKK